ncbi:MAG: motility associated factor glycosyltransferase family protein, partial [Sarcina sp.]
MNFNIEISKDGFDILKINRNGKDIYLGSKYNQKREIDKFIASFSEFTENDVYIVLGASFLEHIKALVEKNSLYKKIAILELDTELREYINRESRYNDILRDKRIEFVSSIDEIKSFFVRYINDFNINFVKIGYYANYDKIYGRELVEIMQYIKDISYSILSNKNTNIYFGETWFNTLIDNLEDMKSAVPVNELRNIHKGKAAIIVSAGPSLEKNIDMLKNNKDMLVLSGGRTLKTLTEKNINIDYLGVVDAGQWSFELVKGNIETTKVPLVFYNGTNRDVVRLHSGKKIFCSDNKFINDIFDRDINHIGGGGSVAHFLTNFAIYTGCNPIIFIGQDLAYTNELLHTDICKTPGVQTNVASNFNNVYVDDINGNKIRTSIILNDFRLILENIISENKDIEFINATEGGANIKGTEIITLEECMKKYDVLTLGGSCIEDLIEIKVPEGEQFKKKIKKYID